MGMIAGRLRKSIGGDAATFSANDFGCSARIPTQPSPIEGEGS